MFSELLINVIVSSILILFGCLFGMFKVRSAQKGANLDDHDLYPFNLDEKNNLYFDIQKFNAPVKHFLRYNNHTIVSQFILIVEQNNILNKLKGMDSKNHKKLYHKFKGYKIIDNTRKYMEDYKRIIRLIGDSFPDTSMEILLHNLANPTKTLQTN